MGNRHLESVDTIFPPATESNPNLPLLQLVSLVGPDGERLPFRRLVDSFKIPQIEGRVARVIDGVFDGFEDKPHEETALKIPLLDEIYPDGITPAPIFDIPGHVRATVRGYAPEIIAWAKKLPQGTNMINVTLGSKWQGIPVEEIMHVLDEHGIPTAGTVDTTGRKRIGSVGIRLTQPSKPRT